MVNKPLISICIPTYNRASILKESCLTLLSLASFDDDLELVISDNNSEDDTFLVVNELKERFPSKKIVYNKNRHNIRDNNFLKALSLGSGCYLKLMNDYTLLDDDELSIIKSYVREYRGKNSPIFFYREKQDIISCENRLNEICCVDDFIRIANNRITWISNFGCWKENIQSLYQFDCFSNMQLLQVYWTLYLVEHSKATMMVNIKYRILSNFDSRRAGYNFFKVQVENYYGILESYREKGLIKDSTIRYDKKMVLSDFIGSCIIRYLILNQIKNFSKVESWKIIIKHFWNIPLFYYFPLYKLFLFFKKQIKK